MRKLDGTRLAEQAAALIGSWRFLIVQACLLALWVIVNGLRVVGFDPAPFILLNLCLSFQAAFTGPVLLIAANVGAAHDRGQSERIENLESILDEHVNTTAREHTAELRANTILTEEIHRMLTERRESVDAKPAHAVRDVSGRFVKAGA